MPNPLVLFSLIGYVGLGAFGLVLSTNAYGTRRYRPAMSYAGLAIALVPNWLALMLALHWFGWIGSVDFQQRLAIATVIAASLYFAIQADRHVRRAKREERVEYHPDDRAQADARRGGYD